MHFNKNDLNAVGRHPNPFNAIHPLNVISQNFNSNSNKACFTETDDHFNLPESNFDRAKKAFFTPEKSNPINPKLNVNSSLFYPKQSQGEISMDNVFNNYGIGIAKFNEYSNLIDDLGNEINNPVSHDDDYKMNYLLK